MHIHGMNGIHVHNAAILIFPTSPQFVVILESVLAKISRYDEGTLFSSFLSFTVRGNRHLPRVHFVFKSDYQARSAPSRLIPRLVPQYITRESVLDNGSALTYSFRAPHEVLLPFQQVVEHRLSQHVAFVV